MERKIIPKWIVLSQNSHFIWEKSRCLHEQFGGIFYILLLFQIFFAMFVESVLFLNWSIVNPVENTKTIHTRISRSSTRIIFKIFLRFMNVFDMYSQMMKKRKVLSTRVTFKISLIFMNVFIRLPARVNDFPQKLQMKFFGSLCMGFTCLLIVSTT